MSEDVQNQQTEPAEHPPLISIVTVTFNAEQHVEQTIQSVTEQSFKGYEYIIIDGASTDRTPTIVSQYQNQISTFLSEPDNGIYDAMNKGIQHARGDLIVLLNAGDFFAPNALERIATLYIQHKKKVAIFYGDSTLLTDKNKTIYRPATVNPAEGMTICHQAMFVHRKIYKQIGTYDLSYRFAADYQFFLRAFNAKTAFYRTPHSLVTFRDHGLGEQNKYRSLIETVQASFQQYGMRSTIFWSYSVNTIRTALLFTLAQLLRKIRRST